MDTLSLSLYDLYNVIYLYNIYDYINMYVIRVLISFHLYIIFTYIYTFKYYI